MTTKSLFERITRRVLAPAVAWLVYLSSYPVFQPQLGAYGGIVAVVPVVVTAWCWGTVPGALAGLAAVPVTALIGGGAMVFAGAAAGHMRELRARLEAEIEVSTDSSTCRRSTARPS
jgi:hypothetical protein